MKAYSTEASETKRLATSSDVPSRFKGAMSRRVNLLFAASFYHSPAIKLEQKTSILVLSRRNQIGYWGDASTTHDDVIHEVAYPSGSR